jgi:hypothetical protein
MTALRCPLVSDRRSDKADTVISSWSAAFRQGVRGAAPCHGRKEPFQKADQTPLHDGALGVLGVFLAPGAANASFAGLAAAFPTEAGQEVAADDVDPNGLLPASLGYWTYEGSLTTPPCTENVDWMVAMEPVEVGEADIERFTALYPMNARPIRSPNRRFILSLG